MPDRPSLFDAAAVDAALQAKPRAPTKDMIALETAKCKADPAYFIRRYCQIYDNATAAWVPFQMWPAQEAALRLIMDNKYTVVLKSRQLGLTWLLGVAYPLWQMILTPIAEVLLFSQRDDEATKMLDRLRGMFERLPDWLKRGITTDAAHEFRLANGSGAQALPASTGGRSNAATYVAIDEADFIADVMSLVDFARPTIDAGANKMVLLSTVNKATPNSYFQRIYKTAMGGESQWKGIFLPWFAHEGRTLAWYEDQRREALATKGSLDSIYEQYPATDQEALASRTLDKRYPPAWIVALSATRMPMKTPLDAPPALQGLKVYRQPVKGRTYGIGADPGGGGADPSTATVVEALSKEQVAVWAGPFPPVQFADGVADLALYYNGARVNFELNNHGHAVREQLKRRGTSLLAGWTKHGASREPGWLETAWSKSVLYDTGEKVMQEALLEAEARGEAPPALLADFTTVSELASITADDGFSHSLRAPDGQHDDHAVAWVLAQRCVYKMVASMEIVQHNLWGTPPERVIDMPTTPPPKALPSGRGDDVALWALRLRSRR